jgi:5-dehydro-2-deoxygluconokinase
MSDKNELFVLPFDHRGSFLEEMFGVWEKPTEQEIKRVKFFKQIIYNGFKIAINDGIVPKEHAAILVDEEFGDFIIQDAKENGYGVCICAEKSGQKEFDFEYGDEFREHISKYKPEYVKVLVRYNPDEDREMNKRQVEKLKILSDFCHEERHKLMLEPLIPPTESQLKIVDGDRDVYDREMRPKLMELMIEEFQDGGVEPDIWKVEGLEERGDYEMLVEQAKAQGRGADIIILGRHASDDQVEKWLLAGKDLDGVIGFAIGRTIFWDPLLEYIAGEITAEAAAQKIADSFGHFYKVFKGK